MDAGIATIWAAVIAGLFSLLVALLQKFRKENARDHDVVMGMLKYMHKSISRTESKLDTHILEHKQNTE